jgi:hypothetical protein
VSHTTRHGTSVRCVCGCSVAQPPSCPLTCVRRLHGAQGKPTVRIFNAAGRPLVSFAWEEQGRLIAMGWTDDEVLLCVEERGAVLPYSVHGELQANQFSLGSEVISLCSLCSQPAPPPAGTQSVATPQAARGWVHPMHCRHFKHQSCERLGSAFVARWRLSTP